MMKKRFGRYFALIALITLTGMVLFACGQQQEQPAEATKQPHKSDTIRRHLQRYQAEKPYRSAP